MVEPVEFVKETFPNGRFNLRPVIPGKKLQPHETVITKLLDVEFLSRQLFFGARSLATASSKRHALTEVFAKPKGKRGIAVIASTKLECLLIKKVDYLRYATDRCFDMLRQEVLQKSVTSKEVVATYLASRSWEHHKKAMVEEMFKTKQNLKEQRRVMQI